MGLDPTTLCTSSSPLVSLPSELVTKVFIFIIEEKPADSWGTLLVLTSICSHLREVALNAQILWRNIRLGGISSPGREVARQMLKRSGAVSLSVQIALDSTSDVEYLSALMSELHRVQTLRISCNSFSAPKISATVENMPLLRRFYFHTNQPMAPPLILPSDPLKSLEMIQTCGVPYSSLSRLFRPSMTRLDLFACSPRTTTTDFLYALVRMPLIEELRCNHSLRSFHPSPFDPGFVLVTLPHLRKLDIRDDTSACADILRQLVFPVSAFVSNALEAGEKTVVTGISATTASAEVNKEDLVRLLTAIILKLSGKGLLGPVPTPQELAIELTEDTRDPYINIEVHGSEPEERPFFTHRTVDIALSAGDALECICSATPSSLLSTLRELSVRIFPAHSSNLDSHDATWTAGILHLTGLEGLNLYRTPGIWEGLMKLHTRMWHPGDNFRADVPQSVVEGLSAATLPFPRLRNLTLDSCVFRSCPPDHPDYEDDPDDFIWSLLAMVKLRMLGDIPLEILDLRNVRHCQRSDITFLGLFVDKVTWDQETYVTDRYSYGY